MATSNGSWAIDQLANHILATRGVPIDSLSSIDAVAAAHGVAFFPNADLAVEGRMLATATGPVIEINSSRPQTRQQFTKSHEFAHWWLMAYPADPRTRAARVAVRSEEVFCNSLGAAILMPRTWLDRSFGKEARQPLNQNLASLIKWASEAGVSREAAIIRFCDVFSWPLALMTWEKRTRWRYSGECGVRPWEYGRMRPDEKIARDLLPEAASQAGRPLAPRQIEITIDGVMCTVWAEIVASGCAGYALFENPFLARGRRSAPAPSVGRR